MNRSFALYHDKKSGNHFVIHAKGHVYIPDKDGWDSRPKVSSCAHHFAMFVGQGVELAKENGGWLDVPGGESLPHVKADMLSPHLQNGGCTVWIVRGPAFDDAAAMTAPAKTTGFSGEGFRS